MKENTKEKQIHQNHRNRMKNNFVENGFSGFSEVQKLEFILFFAIPQKDVNPLSHKLLDKFGSLDGVLSASFEQLLQVDGVGKHTALLLKTFRAVADEKPKTDSLLDLGSTKQAKDYCFRLLSGSGLEEFYVLCLDENNKLLKAKRLSSGTKTKVAIEIATITKLCFDYGATKIIITHNHPSGNAHFSDDDLHLTHNIMCSCLLNEISLIDHILVTPETTLSLAATGNIKTLEQTAIKRVNLDQATILRLSSPTKSYIINTEC